MDDEPWKQITDATHVDRGAARVQRDSWGHGTADERPAGQRFFSTRVQAYSRTLSTSAASSASDTRVQL
jgi:predicted metalloprotease